MIEEHLAKIEETWKELELDIVPYKDKGHFRLRSAEDIVQALDDNQVSASWRARTVQIATHLASR